MSISSVSSAYSSYDAYLSAKSGKSASATAATAASAAATTTTASTAQNSALKQIDGKLQMGIKLTAKEMSYLETQDSNAYKAASKINDERAGYRKQLEGAKTKLDVENLRSTKMQELSDELKTVKNDTKLTAEEKTSQMDFIQKRQMAIVDETSGFTSTSKYNNLSLTTKSNFENMLSSEDSDISNLLSYLSSSKTDATSFLKIFNYARETSSQATGGYFSSQLNAAQKLVDASFQAQSVRRQSIITQVLARESAKLTNAATSAQATDTAAKLNLTV